MNVRAKFRLTKTTKHHGFRDCVILTFSAEYDPSIPEDLRFARATPNGTLEMTVDNPEAVAAFEGGKAYYLDFIPAE